MGTFDCIQFYSKSSTLPSSKDCEIWPNLVSPNTSGPPLVTQDSNTVSGRRWSWWAGGLRSRYRSISDLRGPLTPSASPPDKLAIKASHLRKRRLLHKPMNDLNVCHLAGQFIEILRKKQGLSLGINDTDQLCVMIAGLCHDLGHGPFSHTYDHKYVPMVRPEKKNWRHEDTSVAMLDYLLEKNEAVKRTLVKKLGFMEADFTFIRECIAGPKEDRKHLDWPYEGRGKEKSFLYDVISNSKDGLDVDRFDYMLRDSFALNIEVTFGKQCMERLFYNSRVMDMENGTKRICYAADKFEIMKDLASVGSTRYRLHEIAYHHKTTEACELMVCDIFKLAGEYVLTRSGDGGKFAMADCMEHMGAFMKLDDFIITRIKFAEVNPNSIMETSQMDQELQAAQNLISRLESRDLYKNVYILEQLPKSMVSLLKEKDVRQEIAEFGRFDPEVLRYSVIRKNFGMGDHFPLTFVMMYDHKDISKRATSIPEEKYPPDLPGQYDVASMMLFSCTKDPAVIEKIKTGVDLWRKNIQLEPGERPPTPVKGPTAFGGEGVTPQRLNGPTNAASCTEDLTERIEAAANDDMC